jgi:hypothetical protein
MTGLSEISAPAVWPAPSPPTLTDGAIAVLNLQAQIDGLQGHGTSAEAATLNDLLILRGLILGRISDYERAARLADRQVGAAITDAAAYVARARTRAVFHRTTLISKTQYSNSQDAARLRVVAQALDANTAGAASARRSDAYLPNRAAN